MRPTRAILLGVATALLAITQTAAAGTTWQILTSPNAGTAHNQLNAVSAASSTSAWAVGLAYNGTNDRTLIERYNGRTWALVSAPNAGTHHNELDAVSAASARDAWAVGRWLPAVGQERTLTEHWNGTAWSVVRSPNNGTSHNELDGVAYGASGVVWAVGHYDPSATRNDRTLIQQYRSGSWRLFTSPNRMSGTVVDDSDLVAVAHVPGTAQMWAVGKYISGTVDQTLIERFTGTRWVVVPSPNRSTTLHNELLGVTALSPKDAWAVGLAYSGTRDMTLVEHWNGTAWKIVSSPNVGGGHNELRAVAATGATNITAVGLYYATSDRTLIEHWNGTAWRVTASPNRGTNHNELDGVTAVPHTTTRIAVGLSYSGTADRTLVERFN